VITVNGFLAKRNKDEGRNDPAIRVTDSQGNSTYHRRVRILGPSTMVQTDVDMDKPNKPYIWLETDSPIETD